MTVIAVKDGVMAADGWMLTGDMPFRAVRPKITRLPDGSLVAGSGYTADCFRVSEWMRAGCPDPAPSLVGSDAGNDEVDMIWLKVDGSVWRSSCRGAGWYPIASAYAIGNRDASTVAMTAMHLGKSAAEAVAVAAEICASIGGEIQVERIGG